MSDLSSLQPELDRIAELHTQMTDVLRLQQQAQAALLLRMKFKLESGSINIDHVTDVYVATREMVAPGFHDQWNSTLDIKTNSVYGRAWHKAQRKARKVRAIPNGPGGTWIGVYPFERDCPMPPKGTSVVYVLYGDGDQAVYVGSTADLQIRLTGHARQGKLYCRWMAVRCANRKAAYELEDQLLRDYKLPLNVRAGR